MLGGGPAGIATAFELTAPHLKDRFEVTVYQRGWRLGGKCASGRNLKERERIEEHGLHMWFGFYDSAFGMIRAALGELEYPVGHPLRTFEEAFEPCDRLVLYDRQGSRWQDFPITFPRNGLTPGDAGHPPDLAEVSARLCDWAVRQWPRFFGGGSRAGEALLRLARRLALGGDLGVGLLPGDEVPARRGARRGGAARARVLALLLARTRDWMWEHHVKDRCSSDPRLRLFFTTFDTFASAISGIVADGVLQRGWTAIDDRDLCQWLSEHGAKEVTVGATPTQRAPVLRAVYDLAFAYPGGDVTAANAAAGTALQNLLRLLFAYRGAVLYRMRAGMGDTVIAPLYELLARRGVRFRYFSSVTDLHLSEDGCNVSAIEVVPQVELAEHAYDPLISVEGMSCWPSEPLWDQLRDGEELARSRVDFELESNPLKRPAAVLQRGRDFDEVVLSIPVGALPAISSEIAARHPRFARMLDSAETVATQAFQIWLKRTPQELGWPHGENSVAGARVEPLDTWCDMSYLLPCEGWRPEDEVGGLAYFCGVLEDRPSESGQEADERVRENARAFIEEHLGELWPRARAAAGSMEWEVLADRTGGAGQARLDAQHWRANTSPSERYVLTPAGSGRHRLAADESGVHNLVLAGDWTRNGIDGGCVEAAVRSGVQAARALIGGGRRPLGEQHPAQPNFAPRSTTDNGRRHP